MELKHNIEKEIIISELTREQIQQEYDRIQTKSSKLNAKQRSLVVLRRLTLGMG